MSEPGVSIPARWLDPGAVVPVNAETVQLLLKMVANMEKNLNAQRDRAEASRVYAELATALLWRIHGWDMMDTAADGRYWRAEIEAVAKNQCGGSGSLSETPRPSTAHPLPAGLKPEEQLDGGPSASGPATQPEPRTICHETCTEDELGSCMHGVPSDIECAICDAPDKPTPMMVEAAKLHKKLRHQSGTKSPECVVCHRDPKSNPYGKCPAWNFMCPHQPATETARHQSGRDPLEAVRELLLDVQSLLDSKAYNLARDGVAGALMKVNEALRPQVVREPASPWIRGRDRLPTENDVRFAYRMHDDGPTYCVDNRGEFDSEFGTDGPPEQIVWMPLPTVPDDPADAVLVAGKKP